MHCSRICVDQGLKTVYEKHGVRRHLQHKCSCRLRMSTISRESSREYANCKITSDYKNPPYFCRYERTHASLFRSITWLVGYILLDVSLARAALCVVVLVSHVLMKAFRSTFAIFQTYWGRTYSWVDQSSRLINDVLSYPTLFLHDPLSEPRLLGVNRIERSNNPWTNNPCLHHSDLSCGQFLTIR